MAGYNFVQAASGYYSSPANGTGTPFTSPNTAGNFLLVASFATNSGPTAPTDFQGNSYTALRAAFAYSNVYNVSLYYATAKSTGFNETYLNGVHSDDDAAQVSLEYSGIGTPDSSAHSSASPSASTTMTSGNLTTNFIEEVVFELFCTSPAGGSSLFSKTTDGSILRATAGGTDGNTSNQLTALAVSDRFLSAVTTTAATALQSASAQFFAGAYTFQVVSNPTANGAIVGRYFSTAGLKAAFPDNGNSWDILQVVESSSGAVLWNLSSAGVSTFNPANPSTTDNGTPIAYLQQISAPSFAAAYGQNNTTDILQIIDAGGNVSFYVDAFGTSRGQV